MTDPLDLAAVKARSAACKVSHECAHQGYGCERCEAEAVTSAADVPALVAEVERLAAENARLRAEVDSLRSDLSAARAALDGEREALAAICDDQASLAKRDRCHSEAGTLHQIAVMIRARRAAEAQPKG